jgi:hypothetical protein
MKGNANPFSSPLLSKDLQNVSKNRSNRSSRPPVYNPWDKFNQSQFDDFIYDITSALSRALNHELDTPETSAAAPARHVSQFNQVAAETELPTSPDPFMSSDGDIEDSFAELKSARAKGKERDPREGPGLGGIHNPIELSSDDDDERVEGNSHVSEEHDEFFGGSKGTEREEDTERHGVGLPADEDIIEIPSSGEEEQPSAEAYDHVSYEPGHPSDNLSGISSRNAFPLSPAKFARRTGWLAEEYELSSACEGQSSLTIGRLGHSPTFVALSL